jgi:tRNA A-37 threonylcarbamoyl transferase component Bud32/tetratricopeptide (TPR) repeat protein
MSVDTDRINQALGGRYRIESQLGEGGMATVYLADEPKHERKVALKVLRPELAASIGGERFLNEIRITANLQHPHILPLFDSGRVDGLLFYVMPHVAGETLKDKLVREKRLGIEESLAIARSVAAALHYAHQQNVVHRDIKPDNVMLTDGLPMVVDFGIAGAIETAGSDRMTSAGLSMGTRGYMSPEQAAGDPVDARSDVFALGCLLFEMVTGERPFEGRTSRSVLAQVLTQPAPSPSLKRDGIPDHVDAAIRRALAKDPSDRFSTAAEMAAALTGGSTAPVRVREALAIAPANRTPFVARGEERAKLLTALDDAVQGQGSLVLIEGEPGIGKTRLAEEVLLEAQRRGLLCFIGHAYEGEGSAAYTPFVETLEYAARALPEDMFRQALGDSASEVARIMPKLRQLFPDIPPAVELPAEQQRRYLFNSYREFVERGTLVSPLVVLLDDLHWADESSLLLLEHLARHVPTQRALIIGTYRDLESEISPALARTLANLTRQRLAQRIKIRPLEEAAVADLLAGLGGEEPPAEVVRMILRETEGNPFFIEEVVRDLQEQGQLVDTDGRWREGSSVARLAVPESVRLVISRRLERVGEDVQSVLTAAGVVGRGFDHGTIVALEVLSPEALIDALEEAEEAHLIHSEPVGRDTRYRFSHELIRSTLVERLSVPRRRQLHGRIAAAMEALYPDGLEGRASDYSHHLYEAGPAADAATLVRFLTVAADQALNGAAFEDALGHLERALAVVGEKRSKERADLLTRKGQALRGVGEWMGAIECWETALAISEEVGDRGSVASLCETLSLIVAWFGRHDDWRNLSKYGLQAVGEEPSAQRARLLSSLAAIETRSAEPEVGLGLFDQAVALAQELGDEALVGFVQAVYTSAVCDLNAIHQTIELGEQCAPGLRTHGDYWNWAEASSKTEYSYLTAGDIDACLRLSEDVRTFGNRIGHLGALMLDDMAVGSIEHIHGDDPDRLIEWGARGVEVWGAVGAWSHFFTLFGSIGWYRKGDWDAALSQIGVAVEHFPEGWWKGRVYGMELLINLYAGTGRGRELFEASEHRIPKPGQKAWGGDRAFALIAPEALAVMGDHEAAASLYDVALETVEGGVVVWETGLGHRYLGISAACGKDWDVAERHFRTALEQAHQMPFRTEQAETRRWYGWMLMERDAPGDAQRARELLSEAVTSYEEVGMPKHAQRALDLI